MNNKKYSPGPPPPPSLKKIQLKLLFFFGLCLLCFLLLKLGGDGGQAGLGGDGGEAGIGVGLRLSADHGDRGNRSYN